MRFPSRLRVMAEYATSGIWVAESIGPWRHGMIEHRELGIPPDLARRFDNWIDEYYKVLRDENSFDFVAFNAEGKALALELKQFVGEETTVLYAAELEDGGLKEEEEIRLTT